MAKLIKFPLVMKNGLQVRSLEELRENFDIEMLLGYYEDGKLEKWLESRHLLPERDGLKTISYRYADSLKQMCLLFDVPYKEEYDRLYKQKQEERIAKKREWIQKNTSDARYRELTEHLIYADNHRLVAFGEDGTTVELYRLSDGTKKTVLKQVYTEMTIPLDDQTLAFLVTVDDFVKVCKWNLVTGESALLDGPVCISTPLYRPVFGRNDEGVFLMYQKENDLAAAYETIYFD